MYNHSSGWDEHTDSKVRRVVLDGDTLSFDVEQRVERENEWITEHEICDETTLRYEYDLKRSELTVRPP